MCFFGGRAGGPNKQPFGDRAIYCETTNLGLWDTHFRGKAGVGRLRGMTGMTIRRHMKMWRTHFTLLMASNLLDSNQIAMASNLVAWHGVQFALLLRKVSFTHI